MYIIHTVNICILLWFAFHWDSSSFIYSFPKISILKLFPVFHYYKYKEVIIQGRKEDNNSLGKLFPF